MKAQREMDTRFYAGLYDLLRRRLALILRDRSTGPVYDPTYDFRDRELGGGRTCSKCRRIVRYDVRVCPSCGTLAG